MMRRELTCVCGRLVSEADQIAFYGRRPCPDCGSRCRKWSRLRPWWRRFFSRHPWPRFRSGDGPRHFAPDWGFIQARLTKFTRGATAKLGLKRRRNRWRFDEL
jgi:hypothetical protein